MKINLKLSARGYNYVDNEGYPILCANRLSTFFELSDHPSEITVVLTKIEVPNSYKVRFDSKAIFMHILLSNGNWEFIDTYYKAQELLREFGGVAWVSIET